MNAVGNLGYNFIEPKFIPKNKDEYYLRNIQNKSGLKYKNLPPTKWRCSSITVIPPTTGAMYWYRINLMKCWYAIASFWPGAYW